MSTILTSGSYVGFGSSTNKTLTLINFAHRIQMRCTLVRWNPLSIASNYHSKKITKAISMLSTY
jgi:hypothetical protein